MENESLKTKALIVDDDTFLVSLYKKMGEETGMDLRTASSGEEALALLIDFVPDIIALDMSMAGLSGLDTLKEIRAKNLAPNAKVIILSNTNEDDAVVEAKGLGVEHFIVKASLLPSQVMEELTKIAHLR
jgi:CheY-like chemotaxis protein